MAESTPPSDKVKSTPAEATDTAAADLSARTWSSMGHDLGRAEPRAADVTKDLDVSNYSFFKTNSGDLRAAARSSPEGGQPQILELSASIVPNAGDAIAVKAGDRSVSAASDSKAAGSLEQKMFDPATKPEDKVKIAEELVSQGKNKITGPDGKTYTINSEKSRNGRNQIAVFADGDGKHPILRGVVNADKSVSKQVARNGKEVDFAGDWVRKNNPDNPMIKQDAPRPVVPSPEDSVPPRPAPRPEVEPRRPVPRQPEIPAPQRDRVPPKPETQDEKVKPDPAPGEKPSKVEPTPSEHKPDEGILKPTVVPNDTQPAVPGDSVQPTAPQEITPVDAKFADSDFDYLRKNFKGLDQDNNDHVTKDEVDKFMEANKGKLSDAETKTLTKFKENIGKLESIHDDEFGIENDGVTRNDLNDGEKRMKAYEFADKHFDKMDGNGDGFVTEDELSKFGKDNEATLSAPDKAALDYLKKNVSDLEGHSNDEFGIENDGFTKKDIIEARKDDGSESFRTRQPSDTDQLRLPDYNPRVAANPGLVTSEDFSKEALRLFDTIDGDKDGHLSDKELADAVQSDKFTGKDAQVVAALYAGRDELEELSNDEYGDENDGPTKKDLEAFETLRKTDASRRKEVSDVSTWLQDSDRFKTLDKDGDKFLSYREITDALKQPDLSEKDKINLEFLKKNYSELEDAHDDETGPENDGITQKDMDYFGDSGIATVTNALITTYNAQNGSRELFGGKTNPLDAIKPDAIQQGMIGDCYFESAVAALAATNPEQIKNMITDNHDGTYTVTFPGDKDQPITVDAPTDAEKGLYNRGGTNGSWANVLEKAYGKYCVENPSHRSPFNLGGGNTLPEGADGGEFFHGRAMSLLTGKGRDGDSLMFTSTETLRAKLTDALAGENKRPVIAGINNGFGNTEDGFYKAHMYSITAFDPNGPDGGTVTVRNPWGGADDSTRGTKRISLKQFQSNFSEVVFTEK
ncbi:hypothetical protein KF913_22400 [Candidatus Obscuribacterales bacterium]|nr:hypothetical protein [Candidatus Obscuribacterales bacterium]